VYIMSRPPPMFGTFSVAVNGSDELCRGIDTLHPRHDARKLVHPLPVNHH